MIVNNNLAASNSNKSYRLKEDRFSLKSGASRRSTKSQTKRGFSKSKLPIEHLPIPE